MPSFYGDPPDTEPVPIEEFVARFYADGLDWIRGRDLWREWLLSFSWLDEPDRATLDLIERFARQTYEPMECPRAFVSHRQHDEDLALRVAWIVNQARFQFWIDSLDPKLQYVTRGGRPIPQGLKPVVIASLIELALLNCSHVIALLTPNSRGSLWIPYEYGRVKRARVAHTRRAAVWLSPKIDPKDDPEYTLLAIRTAVEPEISHWLQSELAVWQQTQRLCANGADDPWKRGEPEPLPS